MYQEDAGWSNELVLPVQFDMILNTEGPDRAFYGLRNDEVLEEGQDFIAIYPVGMVQK